MFYYLIQRSYFGRLVYWASNYKYFTYPEEKSECEIPKEYLEGNGPFIITWDEDNDVDYPRNWPKLWRYFVQFQITFLTIAIYIGGPIFTPAVESIKEEFNIGDTLASFPLAFYIFGYGLSPMVLSPLSEQDYIGRTPIYIYSGLLFTILQIPTALSTNIVSMTILRFLGGFFGAPALSVGPGSYTDTVKRPYVPIILAVWALAALFSPSVSPIIGSALLLHGWRAIIWFLMAMNGVSTLMLFFFLPETYEQTLLLWKAQRLRRITGKDIRSVYEVDKVPFLEELSDILKRAFEIIIMEPMVLLMDLYQGLLYGLLFLWFETFPIVYTETYKFTGPETSAAYISLVIGCIIGSGIYCHVLYHTYTQRLINKESVEPEVFLNVGLLGATMITGSMFLYGWLANPNIFWIGTLIAATIFGSGVFITTQSVLNYMAMCFPKYIPSVFAGNGFFRSAIGGSFPIYGRAIFKNTKIHNFPVGWGCTILGLVCLCMNFLPVVFKYYGPKLRSKSKYST